MDFAASSESTAFMSFWMNPIRRPLVPLLLPRIGFRDNQANRVLVKSLETAFALQILQMTHDRPSPQNAFVGSGFGRRNGELIDRH
jgi:hypothetical protein